MKSTVELQRMYPHIYTPIRCENGCGAVIGLVEAFTSYKRGSDGEYLLICECCAAEEGHRHEDMETPETSPICHRKLKGKVL